MKLCEPSRCTAKLPDNINDEFLIAEEKLDGSRYVLYIGDCPYKRRIGNTILSRRYSVTDNKLIDKTDNIPHITHINYNSLCGTVLDGEIMSSTFLDTNSIMNSLPIEAIQKQKERGYLKYHVFDVMFHNGQDIRLLPLIERRQILEQVIKEMNNEYVIPIPWITNNIQDYFKQIVNNDGEGLIIKDVRKAYGQSWSKMKKSYDVSCIVSGYKMGTGKYKNLIGSLAVSVIKDNKLVEIGFISGYDDQLRKEMTANFSNYNGRVVDVFAQEIQKISDKNPAGRLRHPTFHRFRDDMNAQDCTFDKMQLDIKTIVKSIRKKE